MSEEEGGFENSMRKIAEFEKKQIDAITKNTREMSKMRESFARISVGVGNIRQSRSLDSMGIVSQQSYQKLVEQTKLMRDQLTALERLEKQFSKYNPKKDSGTGEEYGTLSMIFKHLGKRIGKAFEPITRILSPILKSVWNIGKSVWGGLKKAGLLPGVFAGIGIAVGAVIAKVIQSSPLLTAMMKMMNMGITLMLRPIGDFIGSVLRPMMIYFIKDVAVPFFQATKGLVNDGGKIGKGLLAFFIQPIESIGAAIIKALNVVLPAELLGGKNTVNAANMMLADPARMFRERHGIGEFKYTTGGGAGLMPSDTEWINMLQGTKVQGLGEDNDVFTGSKSDIEWLMKERGDDNIMAQHYTTSRWKQLAKDRERLFLATGSTSGFDTSETMVPGTDIPKDEAPASVITPLIPYSDVEAFWEWMRGGWDEFWEGITNPFPEAAGEVEDAGDAFSDITDTLGDWGESWDEFVDSVGKAGNDWGRQISRWADEQGQAWNGFTKQIEKDTQSWLEWAGGGIEQAWEWITNFGKVNEAFADTGEETEEVQTSLIDSFWSFIESIKVGIFGTRVAVDAFADTIVTAGDKITTAADVATGGIFQGSGHGRDTSAGTSENPWNPIDAVIGAATGQPSNVFSGVFGEPTTGGGLYGTPKADDIGHSNLLGEYSDTRFESSPGKFVDIYSKGEKVDPNSEEGKIIQGIYQKQHDAKIANDKQQAIMATVKKEVTTADAGKAYILAGGGEAGLAAVEMAKAEGLSMTDYGDIVKMSDALGLKDHPMIKTAREGLASQIAMAEKIMAQRIAAGQTPSIQGDMLGLFPNVEDSEVGWSDEAIAKIGGVSASVKAAQQALSDQYGITTYNVDGSVSTTPSDDSGSDDSSGGGGGNNNNVGGTDTTGDGGGWNTGLEGQGVTVNKQSNNSSNNSRSDGGNPGAKARAAGYSRGNRRHSQYGGIIDEPIVGIGIHTGQEYTFGESGREVITPIGAGESIGGGGDIVINIGNITKEADYMKLKPLIQRWILEASSRRGTV